MYRTMNNQALNVAATYHNDYSGMVESALNRMEEDDWRLVAIEQPASEDGEALYIFHKEDDL